MNWLRRGEISGARANIASNKKVKFVLKPSAQVTPHDAAVLKILLNADPLEIDAGYAPKKGTPAIHAALGDLYMPLEGLIDVTAEKARLNKELEKISAEILKVEQKLGNPAFTEKVPVSVLQEHEKRLIDWQAKKEARASRRWRGAGKLMKLPDHARAMACAVKAARAVGKLMRQNLAASKRINLSSPHDIKLELDVRSQKLIRTDFANRISGHRGVG